MHIHKTTDESMKIVLLILNCVFVSICMFFRYVKSFQAVLVLSICVCLIIANLVFLFGITSTQNEVRLYYGRIISTL